MKYTRENHQFPLLLLLLLPLRYFTAQNIYKNVCGTRCRWMSIRVSLTFQLNGKWHIGLGEKFHRVVKSQMSHLIQFVQLKYFVRVSLLGSCAPPLWFRLDETESVSKKRKKKPNNSIKWQCLVRSIVDEILALNATVAAAIDVAHGLYSFDFFSVALSFSLWCRVGQDGKDIEKKRAWKRNIRNQKQEMNQNTRT